MNWDVSVNNSALNSQNSKECFVEEIWWNDRTHCYNSILIVKLLPKNCLRKNTIIIIKNILKSFHSKFSFILMIYKNTRNFGENRKRKLSFKMYFSVDCIWTRFRVRTFSTNLTLSIDFYHNSIMFQLSFSHILPNEKQIFLSVEKKGY